MRFLLYENDVDFQRIINVPSRGIGNKTMEFLMQYAQKNNCSLYQALLFSLKYGLIKNKKIGAFITLIQQLQSIVDTVSVSDLVNEVLRRSGYQEELNRHNEQERIENIEELKHSIIEFQKTDIEEKTLKEYLDKVSLYTNNDRASKEDAVKLMTIHASKGLEFKNVFIIRISDGILPSSKVKTPEGLEEERRLFYVAIARAKDKLYLTDTRLDYNELDNIPSRFLKELDYSAIDFATEEAKDRISVPKKYIENSNINNDIVFKIGDRIRHFIFGDGTIEGVDLEQKIYIIKFDKFDTLRNISTNVRLEKI